MNNLITYYNIRYFFKKTSNIQIQINQTIILEFTNLLYLDRLILDIEKSSKYEYETFAFGLMQEHFKSLQNLFYNAVNPYLNKNDYLYYFILQVGHNSFLGLLQELREFLLKNKNIFEKYEGISNKFDCIEYSLNSYYCSNDNFVEYGKDGSLGKNSINILIDSFTGASLLIDSCSENMLHCIKDVANNKRERYEIYIQDLGRWNATIDVQHKKSYYYGILDDDKDFYKDNLEVIFEIDTNVLYELLSLYKEFVDTNTSSQLLGSAE